MKKVIMLVSNSFDPDPRPYKEALSLVKKGLKVTIYAWDRTGGERPAEEVLADIKIKRIAARARPGTGLKQIGALLKYWALLIFNLMRDNYDVIHAHRFDTLPPAFLSAKLRRKPLIYDLHIPFAKRLSVHKKQRGMKFVILMVELVENYICKHTQHNITDSPVFSDILRKKGIHNVIDLLNTPSRSFCTCHTQKRNKNELWIGRIGLISEQIGHGVGETIDIFKRLMASVGLKVPIKLLLLGKIVPSSYRKKIIQEIGGIEDRIILQDHVPYDEVPKYYAQLDISIILYDFHADEGGSLNLYGSQQKVFESMGFGVPIVLRSNSYMEDIVEKHHCGITVGYDIMEIFHAVELLAIDENLRHLLGENGKRVFEQQYNWESEETKLLKIYQKLL